MKSRRRAVALKYEQNLSAPMVTASGMGYIADKILEKAEDNSVPVVYNKELTDLLCNVDVGDDIPSDIYEAVAYVIAHVAELDKRLER